METGWIKIHRKLLEWEWADDPNMVALWIHLLLNANLTDKKYRGKTIPRGSFKTSLNELVSKTGLSKRNLRTCLERLKSTHEVTQQTTHEYSIITICKFDTYQLIDNTTNTPNDTPNDTQATHQRHTSDTPNKEKSPTPPKESIEEGKNERTISKEKEKEKETDPWDVLFGEWLAYKKQRGQTYKGQMSIERMKTKLRNLSGGNIETAKAIIDEAMANNWSGFFALKDKPTTNDNYKGDSTLGNEFERKM